jgi:plasmid stabilization system protein ParE
MPYKLLVSKDAHEDVTGIVDYIAHELGNLSAAGTFLDNVEASYKRIASNPFAYPLCNDERMERIGYRKVVLKNYLLIFRVEEEAKTVYIVRVVYGRRDYPQLL